MKHTSSIHRTSCSRSLKTTLILSLMMVFAFNGQAYGQGRDTSNSFITNKTIYSKILAEDRSIKIYTPARPKNNGLYPVLYVLDGEAMTSMISGQVQYLSEAYKIIPSMIIVGIENTDRTRDLTPTHSITGPDGKPDTSANAFGKNSGGGEKFLQFIQQELMPYINNNYPAAPYNILYGHSLGALTALHALVNHPGMFDSYIAISPSLQWDDQSLLKQIIKDTVTQKGFLFFSDANESLSFHQNQIKLDSVLKTKNLNELHFKYGYYPDEAHISEPVKAFYDGIRYIFPEWYLNYNSSAFRKTMTAKMVIDHYASLSKKYGYNVIAPQDEINLVAKMFRRDPKKIQDAIELMGTNTKNYPSSPIAFELLGDIYQQSGDTTRSLLNYETALSLDKSNDALKQKIKKLNHQ